MFLANGQTDPPQLFAIRPIYDVTGNYQDFLRTPVETEFDGNFYIFGAGKTKAHQHISTELFARIFKDGSVVLINNNVLVEMFDGLLKAVEPSVSPLIGRKFTGTYFTYEKFIYCFSLFTLGGLLVAGENSIEIRSPQWFVLLLRWLRRIKQRVLTRLSSAAVYVRSITRPATRELIKFSQCIIGPPTL